MKTFMYTIKDELGIHARPAGALAKEAAKYASKIVLDKEGRQAEAKRLMSVMSLGVKNGQQVTVSVEGPDEEEAAAAMQKFFEDNL